MIGWYQFKLFVEHSSGVSMDALHMLVGFLLYLAAARLMRRSLRSPLPWLALLILELANEAYDFHIEIWPDFASQLGEGAKDLLLTMALPSLMSIVACCRPAWLIDMNSADDDMSGRP